MSALRSLVLFLFFTPLVCAQSNIGGSGGGQHSRFENDWAAE